MPYPLSREQERAVTSKARHVRIVAGAGAGKTETLSRRIVYLLLVEGCQPSEIVAFTFTDRAAQGMKDRVYRRVADIAGPERTSNLGEMFIGTMHSYAKRVLDDHFHYGAYDVLDENQEIAFLMRHGWTMGLSSFGQNYADGCLVFRRTVNMVWDEMLERKLVAKKASSFDEAMNKYAHLLDENRRLTFGQMMYLLMSKVAETPEALGAVKHLIVDEYQDVNRAQAKLVEIMGERASVFVVGDPRQSIYQWRGSDERFFADFLKKFEGAATLSLRENRRGGQRLVRNANAVADKIAGGRYESMEPFREEQGFLALYEADRPEDEAKWIAEQIQRLVNKGLSFSDIAVLMRSVATSGPLLLDELRKRGIPCLVGGKVGLFRKPEAQAVGRIFVWFYEDGFWVEDKWKWDEKVTGDELLVTALGLWEEGTGRVPGNHARAELSAIKDDLASATSKYGNFTEIYNFILNTLGFHDLNPHDDGDLAIMASLGRFGELLTDYETANRLGGRTPKWRQDLKNLCWYLNTYATHAYEDRNPESIGGVNAVRLLTVHQAKGLEWPIVFVSSVVSGRFPTSMTGREQLWCGIPRDLFDVERYEGSEQDERRLFYVATTRPRDALILTYFTRMKNAKAPSPFLSDLPRKQAVNLSDGANLPKLKVEPIATSEEMVTLAAGDIVKYEVCPYRYALGDILGFQPGLHFGLGFGKSLHYCLRRAAQMVKDEGYSGVSAVASAVDEEFHMPFAGGQVLEDFKRSGRRMLVEFARKHEDDFARIKEVEYRLEFPVAGATILGRVDVILREGGGVEVRDYKTSEDQRGERELTTQVRLYALGLQKLGWNVVNGSIAFIEQARVKPIGVDDRDLRDTLGSAETAIKAISKAVFEPKPDVGKCKQCDFYSICRYRAG
ncbi:MAG TPA: ATP-dependent DNA helicase [Candidatus Bathyarchaeia archaeon]